MYAVIETGGKQYRVTEGDVIRVEKLDVEPGKAVTIKAQVVENGKAKKVVIYKYKAKKDSKKKQGHRQPYTELQIKSVSVRAPRKKAETAEAEAAE